MCCWVLMGGQGRRASCNSVSGNWAASRPCRHISCNLVCNRRCFKCLGSLLERRGAGASTCTDASAAADGGVVLLLVVAAVIGKCFSEAGSCSEAGYCTAAHGCCTLPMLFVGRLLCRAWRQCLAQAGGLSCPAHHVTQPAAEAARTCSSFCWDACRPPCSSWGTYTGSEPGSTRHWQQQCGNRRRQQQRRWASTAKQLHGQLASGCRSSSGSS